MRRWLPQIARGHVDRIRIDIGRRAFVYAAPKAHWSRPCVGSGLTGECRGRSGSMCFRRGMIALSPITRNYLGIAQKALATVLGSRYLPWKIFALGDAAC
jgi:hypothetical protein